MELFDTHFHWYKDLPEEVIASEALENDVKYLCCIGGDYNSSADSMLFADTIQNSWFTAGVHPHEAALFKAEQQDFTSLLNHKKCVAVGEIGLDFFYEHSAREIQAEVFEEFCRIAIAKGLPMVIHCRDKDGIFDAYEKLYSILLKYRASLPDFVVHCYTGNIFWLEKFLELGAYIGITGIVTFPKAHNVRELLPLIPDDKLLIETDSPYLAPKPFRGKTNYPKYLKYVAAEIAEQKRMLPESLADMTTCNAVRFYKIRNMTSKV